MGKFTQRQYFPTSVCFLREPSALKLWNSECPAHLLFFEKPIFASHLRAKVRCQRPPSTAGTQPWTIKAWVLNLASFYEVSLQFLSQKSEFMTKLMATTSSKQLKSSITVGFTCVHVICELFVHAPKGTCCLTLNCSVIRFHSFWGKKMWFLSFNVVQQAVFVSPKFQPPKWGKEGIFHCIYSFFSIQVK